MPEGAGEEKPATGAAEPQGVGGWLAFLIFSMGILSPLVSLYFFFRNTPAWHWGVVMSFGVEMAACAFFIIAAWRLYRRHVWRSVQFAIIALWVGSFALTVFIFAVTLAVAGWEPAVGLAAGGKARLFKQFAYPVVWTLYLLRSVRVRNTYRREGGGEAVAHGPETAS